MKITPAAAARFLANPTSDAVLIYGPDRGLVRERVDALITALGVDRADPFAFTDLTADDAKTDPARLDDEMRALAFGGGARVVRLTANSENAAQALEALLKALDDTSLDPAATLVVEAGDLTPRSRMRKAFEKAARAAAVACYADGPRERATLVDATLKDAGLSLEPDARDALAPHLEGDRALARAELEKLIAYMGTGENRRITADDVLAIAAGAEPAALQDIAYAASAGDARTADDALQRALISGLNAVAVCRALQRHLAGLYAAAGRRDATGSADDALKAIKPPLFGPRRDAVKRQLSRWTAPRLQAVLAEGLVLERRLKTAGAAADALVGRYVLSVAKAAGRR